MNLVEALRAKQQQTEELVTFLSQEGEDETPDTEEPIVTEEEAEEETVEDPEDIEKDVEKVADDVEKADDTAAGTEDLQNLLVGLQNAQRNGGLTATDAMFAQDLAAAGAQHMGIKFVHQNIDMQSFQTANDRAEYTALALEGVKNAVSSGLAKIWALITKVWNSVTSFCKRWLFSWGRIQARAKALQEKVQAMGKDANTVGTITDAKVIKTLVKKGHTKISEHLARDIEAVANLSKMVNRTIAVLPKHLANTIGDEDKSPFEEDIETINRINKTLSELPQSAPKPAEGTEGGDADKKSWWKLTKKDPVEYPKEVPALGMSEINMVLSAITKLAVVRASQMREENKNVEAIISIAKRSSAAAPASASGRVDNNNSGVQAMRQYPAMAYAYLAVSSWSTRYASAVLDYVEASLPGKQKAKDDTAKQPEAK